MRHNTLRLACGLALCAATLASAPAQAEPKMSGKMSGSKMSGGKMGKAKAPKVRTLPGGLKVQDLRVGKGAVATPGKSVTVHYRGTLTNGKKFDASYDRGEPFTFPLGAGRVIQGWDQGVKGMRVGGKRKLTIPAPLAYGAQSPSPDIPANSTLVFTVELLGVS